MVYKETDVYIKARKETSVMKNIECTFYRPAQVNIREFQNIVDKLEQDFHTICAGEADQESTCKYARALLKLAKPLTNRPEMYFLGLDEPENMPSDARVDFFYRPTYLATAVVIKAYMTASELLNEGSDHLIFRGMLLGSTGRGFKGHGYDDLKGLLDTLDLFTEAGAAEFVRYHPYYCIEFKKLFRESVSMIEKRLAKGALCNEWGEDFTEEAQRVISRL